MPSMMTSSDKQTMEHKEAMDGNGLVIECRRLNNIIKAKNEKIATEQAAREKLGLAYVKANKLILDSITMIVEWGGVDGAHHKDWTLDQTLRILAGDSYDAIVRKAMAGEDGSNTYSWEVGIAP